MTGERNGTKPGNQRGGQRENAALQGELQGCGIAERDQALDTRKIDVDGGLEKCGAVPAVVPEQ